MSRAVRAVIALILVLAAAPATAVADPGSLQVVDGCGDAFTGVETGTDRIIVKNEQRDPAFDIDTLGISTVRDVDGAPAGVSITLDTCAAALPEVELPGSSWQVRWDTPDNALGERCNATVMLDDRVDPDDPAARVIRGASLYQVCSRPSSFPLPSSTAYTAHSVPLDDVAVEEGAITWTLRFDELDDVVGTFVAPGVEMGDPGATARDGRRLTELTIGEQLRTHVAAGDGAGGGGSFTIGD